MNGMYVKDIMIYFTIQLQYNSNIIVLLLYCNINTHNLIEAKLNEHHNYS